MHTVPHSNSRSRKPAAVPLGTRCGRALIAFSVLAALVGNAQQVPQAAPGTAPSNMPTASPGRLHPAPEVVVPPSASAQQNFDAVNAERRKQIADDSAKLLKLATELKSEVDKTSKDTLSLGVIRKAEEIERLARGVKEKMRLSGSSN
jgi:hypothetical protein